jgi:tetratricopeptide (TPR) repeat protein
LTPRPLIFVSAVTRELRSARQLVANTLMFLGYEPIWQDVFGTEEGDLREVLRRQIDRCKGVVQLIGRSYGAEPPQPDPNFGRVSYTQYEALYARQRGKKVWYLFIDQSFPVDSCDEEPVELRDMQTAYRQRVKADSHMFHALTSAEGLEASVLKMRADLHRLRRGLKQWAIAVALLLVFIAALGIWLLYGQRRAARQMGETKQAVSEVTEQLGKLRQAVMQYSQVETHVSQGSSTQGAASIQERIYIELAKQFKLDPNIVRSRLRQVAEELQRAPNATNYERANAAYVSQDYVEAERLALQAAQDAKMGGPPTQGKRVQALKLAGLSAHKRIQYTVAMEHFRAAEELADRQRDPATWSDLQLALADVLLDQGQYRTAESNLRSVVEERIRAFGAEDAETLRSRNRLAYALWRDGRYKEAEHDFREIIALEDRILGPEHADTLLSRNGLAIALDDGGKHSEAEHEHREIFAVRSRVLGPEHPDTLRSRNNLALALNRQGKYTAAENDFRELIRVEETVLGAEHPETLRTRSNLVVTLGNQGKDAEAEVEFRQLIKLEEKVLGAEHPDTLRTRTNVAYALAKQDRYSEAEEQFREIVKIQERVLGSQHPATLTSRMGLASVLIPQGKQSEADTQCREVIELQEKLLGPDHPNTLESYYRFAYNLARQNKMQEARRLAQRAADGAIKLLGADHPVTQKYAKLVQDLATEK